MVFLTSDKKNCPHRYYSKTGMLYNIKHGHLQFDWTPITVAQKKEAADNKAELVKEAHALSQMSTGAEPLDRSEAKCRPGWPEWLQAKQRKWKELKQCNTYRWVSMSEPKEKSLTIISSKFAYKQKLDQKKAHLVAHGCFQPKEQIGNKFCKNGSDKSKSGSGKGFDFDVEPVEVKLYPGLGFNGPGVLKTGKGCPNSLLSQPYRMIAPKWDESLIRPKVFAKEDCSPWPHAKVCVDCCAAHLELAIFDRLHLNDAKLPVDVHTQTGDDAHVLAEAADSTQVMALPHCTFDTCEDFERAQREVKLAEYTEYVALASGWGMGRLYEGDVINETFVRTKDSQMHCPVPTFDAWRALPVYERYHPPVAPNIFPTSFGYHCNTTEMCWYTGGRAVHSERFKKSGHLFLHLGNYSQTRHVQFRCNKTS